MNLAYKEDFEKKYTHKDYLDYIEQLDEGKHAEFNNGLIIDLARPRIKHQRIATNLSAELRFYLKGKSCRVHQEVECDLFDDERQIRVPDLLVNCKPEREGEFRIQGTPEIMIEILSPSTASSDYILKRRLYERAGVREYWIVDPEEEIVTIYHFDSEEESVLENKSDVITSAVLKDFALSLTDLFG